MDIKERKYANELEQKRHPWELARFEVAYTFIKTLIGQQHKPLVLDLGCGDTFFLENLAERIPQANYYGVDTAFTPALISQYAAQLVGKPIQLSKKLDEISLTQNIDLVLLMDVIEHIEEDRNFLKQVLQHPQITAQTYFLITVPAYQSLFCSHDVFLDHYRRYDNKSLKDTVQNVGMKVDKIGYFFFSLLPVRVLQVWKERLFSKDQNSTTGLVEWKGSNFTSQLLKGILYADFKSSNAIKKLTGIRLPGLSNYVICRKSVS